MTTARLSVARKLSPPAGPPYLFLFRTNELTLSEADVLFPILKDRFPSPEFKISIQETTTTNTTLELS